MKEYGYKKYGDFNNDGSEFTITRHDTPRVWKNYAWNKNIYVMFDQRGRGESMYRAPNGDRTYLINDRTFFVKNNETNEFWTLGWTPVKKDFFHYKASHGLGYSRYEMNYTGISGEWTITGAVDDPLELWDIKIKNNSENSCDLSFYPFVEFDLRGFDVYCEMENTILAKVSDDKKIIRAYNLADERHGGKNNCFMALSKIPDAYETSKNNFLGGCYGTLSSPDGINQKRLNSFSSANEDLVGVAQFDRILKPGEEFILKVAIGPFCNDSESINFASKYLIEDAFQCEMNKQKAKTEIFDRVDITIPDKYFNSLFNKWTKQVLNYLIDFNRAWSVGFRDSCQDVQALAPYDPSRARDKLIEIMSHQNSDGSTLRSWAPIDTHNYADGGVWLVFTLSDYIKETGDFTILDEIIPYYDSGEDSAYEHAIKGLRWIYDTPGPHGLTKTFFGDWNDCLDIGNQGKGESVWLAIALTLAHKKIIELAEVIDDNKTAEYFSRERKKLIENIEKDCWDGEWYLRGFTDLDEKVGSQECDEGKIFCLPQAWAIIAGIADEERMEVLEKSLQKHLMKAYGLLVVYPCFRTYRKSFGRITTRPPGWGVNGSSYCHVTAFKAFADCMRGAGNAALESIMSISGHNPNHDIDISGVEPYAWTNMLNGPEHARTGVALRSWYTGTVPWILRTVTEQMIGVRPEYDGILISPVLPDAWTNIEVRRVFREAVYNITIKNKVNDGGRATKIELIVDGALLDGNKIPYEEFKGTHEISVTVE